MIAVLAMLQLLTEVVIGINYAFGQVFVTPMALLMTHLAPRMAPGRTSRQNACSTRFLVP